MTKALEYLDLELKHIHEKISLDKVTFYCFANGNHKHKFHSEDHQLNFLCDTSLTLLYNLTKNQKNVCTMLKSF